MRSNNSFDDIRGQIYRLPARMLNDRGAAEDITQEVFLTAWRRLPEIRADAAFVGWLYRTATNRCLNALRDRRPSTELDPGTAANPEAQPERVVEASARAEALLVALPHLNPELSACWLLRDVHERSYVEIAETLAVTTATVRGRIARARAQLAEALQPWR